MEQRRRHRTGNNTAPPSVVTPPPVVIPPDITATGGGIAPNLNPFASTAPGQEGDAFDQALAAQQAGAGSNAYWDQQGQTRYPKVYWGTVEDRSKMPDNFVGPVGDTKDQTLSLTDSINQSALWDKDYRQAIALKMYKAGMISDPSKWEQVQSAWATVVQDAGLRYAMSGGKDKVTPFQMLDIMVGVAGDLGQSTGTTYPKTTTHSTTNFSKNVIDGETADALVRAIYHDQVGRDPSANELSTYRVMVTGYTRDHPTKTSSTTTSTVDADGNVDESTTSNSSGGWSNQGVQDQVLQKTRKDPEYGAYQAATTYYNALQDLIANG